MTGPDVTEFGDNGEPIHGITLEPGQWWGCTAPERLHDPEEIWDNRCQGCRLRMRLTIEQHGEMQVYEPDGTPKGYTLGEMLALGQAS